MAAPLPLKLEN